MHPKIDLGAVALFSMVILGILALLFALAGCRVAEPMDGPPAFVGDWAGEFTDGTDSFLLTLSIREDGTYTAMIHHGTDTLSRERGQWDATKTIFRTLGQVCEDGPPLRLISCSEDWEEVPLNLAGDTWTLHFTAGGRLQSVTLRRIG